MLAGQPTRVKALLQPLVGDTAWILARRVRRWALQQAGPLRAVYSVAPHDLARYQRLLEACRDGGRVELLRASGHVAKRHRADRVNLVLRHDVDFDPQRLWAVTDLELRCGVRSTIYVRTDGDAYRVEEFQDRFRALAAQGFELGLHSAAYTKMAWAQAFQEEARVFQQALGFPATVMTTHGVHPFTFRLAVRQERFVRELARRPVAGIVSDEFSGCGYDAYVDDANFARGRAYTYLTEDFARIPSLPAGRRVQLLTHPEYWSA